MTEEFLYFIWSQRLFSPNLLTTDKEPIEILDVGLRNNDSGPDFSNARIKIDGTLWAGNIEIHVKSSDWFKHNHQEDKNFQNIILHVVYQADTVLDGFPCLELKGHFDEALYFRYKNLLNLKDWVPCASQLKYVDDLLIYSTLDRLLIERLERKTNAIQNLLTENSHHWESAFYISLARNFGFNVNAEPFEALAKSINIETLAKHKSSILQLEALLFGQSGLLNKSLKEDYSQHLIYEYQYLKHKYNLVPLQGHQWKFMRMRPVNFPTIRIAQFAQLIYKSVHLLSKVVEKTKLEEIYDLFNLDVSDYWLNHYVFGKSSKEIEKHFGRSSFDLIMINTIAPFVFVYGMHTGREDLAERAILWLNQIEAENNSIVKAWVKSGVRATNAAHSQALLTLRDSYCKEYRCLDCAIGNELVRKKPYS